MMLKEIQMNYLGEDEDSESMRKRINYAVEKLNSRSGLFSIDFDPRFVQKMKGRGEEGKHSGGSRSAKIIVENENGDENIELSSDSEDDNVDAKLASRQKVDRKTSAVSAYRRRRSVQVGTNWL